MTRQGHLDQLLAVWEWRLRPTPWLVMTPKDDFHMAPQFAPMAV
jgi:hypothetical protein